MPMPTLPPLAWYDVLVTVDARPAPVRPKDMLCQVSVTKSGLTRLLDRIEKAGLIERTYCPSDRRGTFIAITGAGKDTLAEMRPVREAQQVSWATGSPSKTPKSSPPPSIRLPPARPPNSKVKETAKSTDRVPPGP